MSEPAVAVTADPNNPFIPVVVPQAAAAPDPAAAAAQPAAAAPSSTAVMTPTSVVISSPAGIPTFEGAKIQATSMKIAGTVSVDTNGDEIVSLDDRVRLVGDFRCTGVYFRVDPKTGEAVRMQELKPIEVTLCPWDPSDPTDNGIVRMRP